MQKKLETEDKAQGGAPNSSADTQKKKLKFSESLKRLEGQKKTSQIQMETTRRLLKSNLDR